MRRARLGTARDRLLHAWDRSNGIKQKNRRLHAQPAVKRLVLLTYLLRPIYILFTPPLRPSRPARIRLVLPRRSRSPGRDGSAPSACRPRTPVAYRPVDENSAPDHQGKTRHSAHWTSTPPDARADRETSAGTSSHPRPRPTPRSRSEERRVGKECRSRW